MDANELKIKEKYLDEVQNPLPYISYDGKPLVSLVVLSFNRPNYLANTLLSLKENTHYPYELIVVDDGSMTNSNVPLLQEMAEEKELSCLVINPGKNQGVGASINKGFHMAHGKYLVKLDSDLKYKPGWLTKAVALMETFPEVGILGLFKYHHPPCVWQEMLIRKAHKY